MRYENTKTGAIIDSSFSLSGGDWVEVNFENNSEHSPELEVAAVAESEAVPVVEDVPVVQMPENTGANEAFDSITKAQIMQELDAFGTEYDKRANKQTLYDLMMQGK